MRYDRSLFAAFLMLAACTDEAAEAEKRYGIVKRTGTYGEICAASKQLTAAYLRAGNEERYRWWHMISSSDCLLVGVKGYDAMPDDPPADVVIGPEPVPSATPTASKRAEAAPSPKNKRDPFCDENDLSDEECYGTGNIQ